MLCVAEKRLLRFLVRTQSVMFKKLQKKKKIKE